LIDRSAIVSDAPSPYGPGFGSGAPIAEEEGQAGIEAELDATATGPAAEPPIASTEAATADPGPTARPEVPVVEVNGHANGHSNGHANGSGNGAEGSAVTLNLGGTKVSFQAQADAPSCADCGSIMVRNGSCYKCLNCGSTSGCS
jgi:ribonucleoside-diphosphate reductase alpha chain